MTIAVEPNKKKHVLAVGPARAVKFIKQCLASSIVPMLNSSPGMGKSSIVAQIAKNSKLQLIDTRLSTCEPTDLTGFPMITGSKAGYLPFDTFPLEGEDLPIGADGKPMKGWILFLDEFNSANPSVQSAAYKLVLDRQVGKYNLHKRVFIVCAGNYSTDGAIVHKMSTAMQSRMAHIHLDVPVQEWLEWANKNHIDHRVIAYIRQAPKNLHSFNPRHDDSTFACHRTWEFVSKVITGLKTKSLHEYSTLLMGIIGRAIAMEFVAFTEVYTNMPTYEDILRDPENVPLGTEPAIQFALTSMVSAFCKPADIEEIIKWVYRLPGEFQVMTCRGIVQRDSKMEKNKYMLKWMVNSGTKYL